MNKISFKAGFEGMNRNDIKTIFEYRTKDDKKHTIVFTKGTKTYGEDKFELFKNGEKTAEHKTEILDEDYFTVRELMSIFSLLKAKAAQEKIENMKKKKAGKYD